MAACTGVTDRGYISGVISSVADAIARWVAPVVVVAAAATMTTPVDPPTVDSQQRGHGPTVRLAAEAARRRRGKLTMVDKANVLEASRLWRQVSERVVKTEFPDLQYNVVLVDAMAMHLISRPRDFDVVVTENLFGDILTDEASMLPGSLGLLPSASIGSSGPGLFEPIHGSAPDIAGKNIANPLATILAVAMMLRYSLNMNAEADAIEAAVNTVLKAGHRTKDIAGSGTFISTTAMGDEVLKAL